MLALIAENRWDPILILWELSARKNMIQQQMLWDRKSRKSSLTWPKPG